MCSPPDRALAHLGRDRAGGRDGHSHWVSDRGRLASLSGHSGVYGRRVRRPTGRRSDRLPRRRLRPGRGRGVQELDQAARRRGPWLSIAPHDSIAAMLASLLYLVLRRLLTLVAPNHRSDDVAQIEILVLRHQLGVLRRQVKRPVYRRRDRALLAAASRILPKEHWGAFLVRPETLLGWHRSLVARKWTRPHRPPGRPAIDPQVCKLILQMARENPRWGYLRIKGELGSSGSARPRRVSRCFFAALRACE